MSTPSTSSNRSHSAWVKRPTPHPKSSARPVVRVPADVVLDQTEGPVDLDLAVGEERFGIPAAAAGAGMGQDRPHGISLAEHVPCVRERVEIGRGSGVRRRLVAAEPAEPSARERPGIALR